MRTPIPIFRASEQTPAPVPEPGLVLAEPRGRCGPVAWIHASLTLARDSRAHRDPGWLRNLHVTAITRTDQVVQIAALCHVDQFARPLPWAPLGRDHVSLGFCFDLGAALDYPLHAEPLFVHLSCDALCSAAVVLGTEALAGPVVDDPIVVDDPLARLLDAYTLARLDRPAEAVALFEAVLDHDRSLRVDVDACHLYNAACMLSRAGVVRGAVQWLREDTKHRIAAQTAALLASYAGPRPADPRALEAGLREHFDELARDRDLEALGDRRELAALLEGR